MSAIGVRLEQHLHKFGGKERFILQEYAQEVCAMRAKIDPANEHDWHSLWVGYAVSKGLAGEALTYRFYMSVVFPMENMSSEDLFGPLTPDYQVYLESNLDPRD